MNHPYSAGVGLYCSVVSTLYDENVNNGFHASLMYLNIFVLFYQSYKKHFILKDNSDKNCAVFLKDK